MNIRLENGKLLDFKPDFKLSITLNNPMLAEQGSMSLPAVLPDSDNNRRTLGFPDMIEKTYKLKRIHNAIIESGSYQKPALLRLTSSNKGTVATFYLNESEMYAKMKEVELSQAFDIVRPTSDFHVDGIFEEPIDMVMKYMELVMMDNITEDFHLFPVVTDQYSLTVENEDTGVTSDFTMSQQLNEPMTADLVFPPDIYDTDMQGRIYNKLAARNKSTYNEDGNTIAVPKGYGVTPFLRLNYVLRRIFAYFGYDLRPSIFDTDTEMQKIVVLNTTADALVYATLNYAQLVPSGTINNFLEAIRTDFGCEFFISPDHKYVEVKFWNDLLSNKDYVVLDGKLAGKPTMQYADTKLLKLTNQRGLDFTAVNFDTLEKFEKNYGELKFLEKMPQGTDATSLGYYFIQNRWDIRERYNSVRGDGTTVPAWRYHSKWLFDHYEEKKDADYETKASTREYTPSITAFCRYSEGTDGRLAPGYVAYLPFVGPRRHLNTIIRKETTGTDGSVEYVDQKTDSVESSVMLAFFRGQKSVVMHGPPALRAYGNSVMYDYLGNPLEGGFDLIFGGNNGLYKKFWMQYAEVIRHSFNQINIPLHFDIRDIHRFRFDNIYMLRGQPLIPEKLEYTIDNNDRVKIINAYFRTIRLYKDVNS